MILRSENKTGTTDYFRRIKLHRDEKVLKREITRLHKFRILRIRVFQHKLHIDVLSYFEVALLKSRNDDLVAIFNCFQLQIGLPFALENSRIRREKRVVQVQLVVEIRTVRTGTYAGKFWNIEDYVFGFLGLVALEFHEI